MDTTLADWHSVLQHLASFRLVQCWFALAAQSALSARRILVPRETPPPQRQVAIAFRRLRAREARGVHAIPLYSPSPPSHSTCRRGSSVVQSLIPVVGRLGRSLRERHDRRRQCGPSVLCDWVMLHEPGRTPSLPPANAARLWRCEVKEFLRYRALRCLVGGVNASG